VKYYNENKQTRKKMSKQNFVRTTQGIIDLSQINFIREEGAAIYVFMVGEQTAALTLTLEGNEAAKFMKLITITSDITV
jgi:hypothetical protein